MARWLAMPVVLGALTIGMQAHAQDSSDEAVKQSIIGDIMRGRERAAQQREAATPRPVLHSGSPADAATILKAHAICMADQADRGSDRRTATDLCDCVVAPLKNGSRSVEGDTTSLVGHYKLMQYTCSVEAGPEAFMEQFGNE